VLAADSIDPAVAFRASRWGRETMEGAGGEGAYLNCPMTREEYEAFLDALVAADRASAHAFDEVPYFEGCMPVEEMARRGRDTLRFGPLKPVGLVDPRTGRRPWAVVQLRMEDRAGRMWNMVGFQTRLRYPEQQRVFRMIPGLANAEFLRFGSIHRNSYVNAPAALLPHLALRDAPTTLVAGQLTGVEGYTESTATGILAAVNLARMLRGGQPALPPTTTMLGALYRYLREADPRHFQPMNANFGLVDDLAEPVRDKVAKREQFAERALRDFAEWRDGVLGEPALDPAAGAAAGALAAAAA
jgi:methylenetetrahydrofolate--tRNA-(uracil-5-)-methyltransferase